MKSATVTIESSPSSTRVRGFWVNAMYRGKMIAQTFKEEHAEGLQVIQEEVRRSAWFKENKPEAIRFHALELGMLESGEAWGGSEDY